MEKVYQYLATRKGGAVKRCHTFPHHGEYTVGHHTFGALNILLLFHPNPSIELIKAVQWHDVPEGWVGDIPATAKWSDDELGRALHRVEGSVAEVIGLRQSLTVQELQWLEAVDKLELWFWACEQLKFGNHNVMEMLENLRGWYQVNETPKELEDLLGDTANNETVPFNLEDLNELFRQYREGD